MHWLVFTLVVFSMYYKTGISISSFVTQSKKFIKESFNRCEHKKQITKMSYISFIDFCKKNFVKERKLLLCLKNGLILNSYSKNSQTFVFSKQNASILKDWSNFIQNEEIIFIIYYAHEAEKKSLGFLLKSSGLGVCQVDRSEDLVLSMKFIRDDIHVDLAPLIGNRQIRFLTHSTSFL